MLGLIPCIIISYDPQLVPNIIQQLVQKIVQDKKSANSVDVHVSGHLSNVALWYGMPVRHIQ